jgi:hypothetical protein
MLEDIEYDLDIAFENEILLAHIASEEFTVNRLRPLLNTDNICLRDNVRRILEKAGESHLRRYTER